MGSEVGPSLADSPHSISSSPGSPLTPPHLDVVKMSQRSLYSHEVASRNHLSNFSPSFMQAGDGVLAGLVLPSFSKSYKSVSL